MESVDFFLVLQLRNKCLLSHRIRHEASLYFFIRKCLNKNADKLYCLDTASAT
ncbi:hypothetical protein [Candidatus Kuenenia stuttgartiensis]|uniref:hypothetical protein n=1 Tax=Kuenenia stuttgartiensis TaxID=174633 RepID=UPI0013EBD016|nr:hypothetical protein [Candidatus Kuenenia stuttgartiensis]